MMRVLMLRTNRGQCNSDIFNFGEKNVSIDVPRCALVASPSLLFATGCYCSVSLHVIKAFVCVSLQPRQQFNILPNMETSADVQLNQIVQQRRMTGTKKKKKKDVFTF
jgi:hypothetical protein